MMLFRFRLVLAMPGKGPQGPPNWNKVRTK